MFKILRPLALLLCLSMLLATLASCANSTPGGAETTGETDAAEPQNRISLIADSASDYYIVYSEADANGEWLAQEVQRIIKSVTGVKIKTKSDSKQYDKEIRVGACNRSGMEQLGARLQENGDFLIAADGDSIVLYANTPTLLETMLLTFRRTVMAGYADGILSLSAELSYLFSGAPDDAELGEILTVASEKASDYVIICDSSDEVCINAAIWLKNCIYAATGVFLNIRDKSLEFEHEIYVGYKDSRNGVYDLWQRLSIRGDWAVCVNGSSLVITGNDEEALLSALLAFEEKYLNESKGTVTVMECDNMIGSRLGGQYDASALLSAADYCKLYQSVYKTYSSYWEWYVNTQQPSDYLKDQQLVDAMIERLGESMVFCVDSSSVLYCGKIRKLDVADYGRAAKLDADGTVAIPQSFLDTYYKGTAALEADADGYIKLVALCKSDENLTYYYDSDLKIAIVSPAGVESFSDTDAVCGGYKNATYLARMDDFFHSSVIPEPTLNVEQTRVTIEHIDYPENVLDYRTNYYHTTYSPSITEADGVIYVSYEVSEVCNFMDERSTVTHVKKSMDGGETWTEMGGVAGLRWATVFTLNGTVYLLGNNNANNQAMLASVAEDGSVRSADIASDTGGGAPTAVLIHNGKIYKSFAKRTIHADVNADLFQRESWICSNSSYDVFTADYLSRELGKTVTSSGFEPNIVAGRDGELYVLFRLDAAKPQVQLVAKLTENGTKYVAVGVIQDFPTSESKITVRYDEATDCYLTISNPYLGGPMNNQRIALCLAVSYDLLHWEIAEWLLVPRDMENDVIGRFRHGLQYADFVISGDDILFVVREALGYTFCYHDGTETAFYRLKDYQSLLTDGGGADGERGQAIEVPFENLFK